MKFIEKKCPNCGGDLEFKASDKEVTCNYCQRSFVIEHDTNNNVIDEEAYKLIYSATAGVFGVSKIVFAIVGVFIIAIAITMFIIIGNANSRKTASGGSKINNGYIKGNNNTTNEDKKEEVTLDSLGYVSKFSNIDDATIKDIQNGGIEALNDKISFYEEKFMPKIVKRWKYVGSYFLTLNNVRNDGFGENNLLYDVYEIVYKINNKNVSYYGVVINSNLKLIDSKIVILNSTDVELPSHHLDGIKSAFGFTSIKSVYNDLVSKKLDKYTIETKTVND